MRTYSIAQGTLTLVVAYEWSCSGSELRWTNQWAKNRFMSIRCNIGLININIGVKVFSSNFIFRIYVIIKSMWEGFPGGAVVGSLPASAGDTGSSPGLGRCHMPRSNGAREPQLLSLCIWSLCSATREAAIVRGPRTAMKSGPHLPQLEKALAQKRRPNTAINK